MLDNIILSIFLRVIWRIKVLIGHKALVYTRNFKHSLPKKKKLKNAQIMMVGKL